MGRVAREYDALRSQVEATASHAADELARANAHLEQVGQLMGEQESALEALSKAYAAAEQAKVEAPMPIPEQE